MSAAEQIQAEQELPKGVRQPRHVSRMQEHKPPQQPESRFEFGLGPARRKLIKLQAG